MSPGPGSITIGIFIVIGVAVTLYGTFARRLSAAETTVSMLVSVFVPIIGGAGVAAFVLFWRRNRNATRQGSLK